MHALEDIGMTAIKGNHAHIHGGHIGSMSARAQQFPGARMLHMYTVDSSNSLRQPWHSCSITAGRRLHYSMLSTA